MYTNTKYVVYLYIGCTYVYTYSAFDPGAVFFPKNFSAPGFLFIDIFSVRAVGDIGRTIQAYVEPLGFSVVREYVGHNAGAGC